jgi:hypothetical protein
MMLRQRSRSLLLFFVMLVIALAIYQSHKILSLGDLYCMRYLVNYYYPLEQPSCWRDIGSCPYVRMYVRMIMSCHRSSDFISQRILTKLHMRVQCGKTSNEFAFHDPSSKVKVTVNFLRKMLSSL